MAAVDPTVLDREVRRRRTFAIISHPDAGKTTLTEKLLLYGGAIHLAGAVKAKRDQRQTTSDWMEIERRRGISVSASVLQFEYEGTAINLLDTPGHQDFSEDTYRTLTAVDAAVMVLDGAKGVEGQTRKLFEVCRMRGIPIFTFVNKLDRPCLEPLDVLDELEKVLGIRSCPVTWPIGGGDRFRGVYDRNSDEVVLYRTEGEANVKGRLEPVQVARGEASDLAAALGRLGVDEHESARQADQVEAELELLDDAGDPFDEARVAAGELTPVFFGSALNNFGVERFLRAFIEHAPIPAARATDAGPVEPTDPRFTGFVFKVQANMDRNHRDRVAFLRVCSGHFTRGMSARHARSGKEIRLAQPLHFLAKERVVVEEAWPGDVVGLVDSSGALRIGDTLSEGKPVAYAGVPRFSPEHFAAVRIRDPMKRKALAKGLDQLSEEGVIQVFRPPDQVDKDPILGAVGVLQFDILLERLQVEYGVEALLDRLPYAEARWVAGEGYEPGFFERQDVGRPVVDRDGHPVVLFRSAWAVDWAAKQKPELEFTSTAPMD